MSTQDLIQSARDAPAAATAAIKSVLEEVKYECIPSFAPLAAINPKEIILNIGDYTHITYIPAFWRPGEQLKFGIFCCYEFFSFWLGWLTNYVLNFRKPETIESIFYDMWAGTVVAMTLIPQVRFVLDCESSVLLICLTYLSLCRVCHMDNWRTCPQSTGCMLRFCHRPPTHFSDLPCSLQSVRRNE